MELVPYSMNGCFGWFGPSPLTYGLNHLSGNHFIVQFNRCSKFDELIGPEQLTAAEMQPNGDEVWQREAVGLGQRRCCKNRAEGPGLETNHMGFAVAGAFRKQNATKPVGDSTGESKK